MSTWVKVTLSVTGIFLGGLTTAYQANPTGPPLAWFMGGLAPVGGYLVGFYQLNPAIRRQARQERRRFVGVEVEPGDTPI